MIGLGFFEAAKDMRPAGRQRDPGAGARAGGVSGQRVADDRSGVLAHQVNHAVLDELGSGESLLQRRVVGELDQRRVLTLGPEAAQLLFREDAVGFAVLQEVVDPNAYAGFAQVTDQGFKVVVERGGIHASLVIHQA